MLDRCGLKGASSPRLLALFNPRRWTFSGRPPGSRGGPVAHGRDRFLEGHGDGDHLAGGALQVLLLEGAAAVGVGGVEAFVDKLLDLGAREALGLIAECG